MSQLLLNLATLRYLLIFPVSLHLTPPAHCDSFIWHADWFSESYPSIGVRPKPPHLPPSPPPLPDKTSGLLYNTIYHPRAFVQHPVSYGGQQPVWGWHSVWQASTDAKWQWHKEGALHTGPDRAVFHTEEAWLALKAQTASLALEAPLTYSWTFRFNSVGNN